MVQIIVEGRDSIFIEAYLNHLYPNRNKSLFKIVESKGFTNLKNLENALDENIRINKGINLVIFDADNTAKDYGGLANRRAYLEEQKLSLNRDFNYFLFPNDSDDGDFETLLENIAHDSHKRLFACFEGYQRCVDSYNQESGVDLYESPLPKAKIYAYVEAIKNKTEEEKKRFSTKDFLFDSPNIWNLDAPYLEPLKRFLTTHIDNFLQP